MEIQKQKPTRLNVAPALGQLLHFPRDVQRGAGKTKPLTRVTEPMTLLLFI